MLREISPLDYVRRKGWKIRKKTKEGELFLSICPYCQQTHGNFSINIKVDGYPFQCFSGRCSKKGNLVTLMRDMGDAGEWEPKKQEDFHIAPLKAQEKKKTLNQEWGDEPHVRLLKDEHGALTELLKRGLAKETIKHFKIGCALVANGHPTQYPMWVIPYYTKENRVGLVQYRSIPPADKKIEREKDMESLLFNANKIDFDNEEIVICEGAFDCMSVWQCGHTNVVSVSTGAKGFRPEWVDFLEPFSRIILTYDADEAGNRGMDEVIQRLGTDRCYRVRFPVGQDANDVLREHGDEALAEYIRRAEGVPIEGVKHLSEATEEMQEILLMGERISGGLKWMFPKMDVCLGEVEAGQSWLVTGQPESGKTTLIQQQCMQWAREGVPALLWCGEMTQVQLTRRAVQAEFGIRAEQINVEYLSEAYRIFKDIPLYLGYHRSMPTVDMIIEMMTQAYRRFGVKIVVIDNLATLTAGLRQPDVLSAQSKMVAWAKNWCVQNKANSFIIAHPRKSLDADHIEGGNDVSGSGDLRNLVDGGFTVFRRSLTPTTVDNLYKTTGEHLDRRAKIIPIKTRFSSGEGDVWLYLEGEYSRFREATKEDFKGA